MRRESGIRYSSLWDNIKLKVANAGGGVGGVAAKIDVCSGLCCMSVDCFASRAQQFLSCLQITDTELPAVNFSSEIAFIWLQQRGFRNLFSLPRNRRWAGHVALIVR